MARQGSSMASTSASVSTPTSVAHQYGLAAPPCRFPRNSVHEQWGRRDSYGFPKVQTPSSMSERPEEASTFASDDTLVGSSNAHIPGSRASSRSSKRIVRESSKVYTSFPRPTSSPWSEEANAEEEENEDAENTTFLGRLFQSSASKKHRRNLGEHDEEAGISRKSGSDSYGTMRRTDDTGQGQRVVGSRHRTGDMDQDQKPGVPKLTRECLISEIQCYGKYICAVLLVFVLLALSISLGIYWHATSHR